MTIRFPAASRNAGLDAQLDRTDAGSGPGVAKVYSGGQPGTGDAAATGTLLVTIPLADPAWAPAADGVKTLDADPDLSGVAVENGTAGWVRFEDSAGNAVLDASAGGAGSGADVILNTTTILNDGTVKILTGTITDPA